MVGWAAASITVLAGVVAVLGYVFDQIVPLSDKAASAIEALRRLRRTWRGDYEPDVRNESDTVDSGQSDDLASPEGDEAADQPADRTTPDA
ncbi:hypothetical protein K378_04046 [Streptomyces sp. Amel2xB2]|nr:hypothetical protein K378_04046 [Streptomyces sp. Amel2xB2]